MSLLFGLANPAQAQTPTVTSVSQWTSTVAGGVATTITGTNFTGATAVNFGGTAAIIFSVDSDTSISATVPAHAAGAVDVAVTTPGGTGTGSNLFYYYVQPVVSSVTPNRGPVTGGTPVVITGSGFTGPLGNASSVHFGGGVTLAFTVDSDTQITATTPAASGGEGGYIVSVLKPTSPFSSVGATSSTIFTYGAAPTVTGVSPNSGSTAGGTSVTITGTGFTNAIAVQIGGATVAPFTVVNDTTITATTPAHSAGAVNITVVALAGSGTGTGLYTYTVPGPAPTITAVAPTSGPTSGGYSVTITGTNLTGTTSVTFDGTPAAFSVSSATQVIATAPAHAAGAVTVELATPFGGAAAVNGFSYVAAPTVSSVTPNSGSTAGGDVVNIDGINLSGTTQVAFGGIVVGFAQISATRVRVTTPAHAVGPVNVIVTTAGGAGTGTSVFTYVPPAAPTITAVTLSSGSTAGGQTVAITGTNLTGATAVTFGGAPVANFTVNSSTQITVTTLSHAAGAVDVVVTSPSGVASAVNAYTYVTPALTVAGVTPNSGSIAGGTAVTITGTNLTGVTAVSFGGTAAATFSVVNATTITATTPGHAVGPVDVTVTTAAESATGSGLFTYFGTAPTLTTVTPAQGPSTGGTVVTITGTNLTGATMVTFGGIAARSFSVLSSTNIQATSPTHNPGLVDVMVATPGGSATASGAFSYTIPADSQHLRSAQIAIAPLVAQASGQMISGAIDDAISDAFGGANSGPITQSGNGLRLNLAAEPRGRVDDAFAALAAADGKARPRPTAPKEWLPWMQIAGSNWRTDVQRGDIRGGQVNGLVGLTRRLTDDTLLGVFAGYENFNYTSESLSARLKGDGWTAGGYLSWRFLHGLRADLGLAYSRIAYDGAAGSAWGAFAGERWLASFGLIGVYDLGQFKLEPSARVYTLFERENAYTDSLGTPQDERRFSTGRASGGVKASYLWIERTDFKLSPYAGVYGDFYFSHDNGLVLASTPAAILSGWSGRLTGGVLANWGNGARLTVGSEVGGLGSKQFLRWTGRANLAVPF